MAEAATRASRIAHFLGLGHLMARVGFPSRPATRKPAGGEPAVRPAARKPVASVPVVKSSVAPAAGQLDDLRRDREKLPARLWPLVERDLAPAPEAAQPDARAEYARGRRDGYERFRARAAAILGAPAAGANTALAAHLLLKTDAPAAECIPLMEGIAAGDALASRRSGLAEAMAARDDPRPGADGPAPPSGNARLVGVLASANAKLERGRRA